MPPSGGVFAPNSPRTMARARVPSWPAGAGGDIEGGIVSTRIDQRVVRLLRRAGVGVAVLALLGTLLPLSPSPALAAPIEPPTSPASDPAPAPAIGPTAELGAAATVDTSQFDPGFLIADHQFFDNDAMTQAQIQAFLESRGGNCATSFCLDTYRMSTASVPSSPRCNGYLGADNELASTIIFKVQASCNVSARVLLVTLDKEQSLVSGSWPRTDLGAATFSLKLTRAMGYFCPDDGTGQCHPDYAGFQRQVLNAAAQFQRYRLDPSGFNFQPGPEYIQYNPNPACGGSIVNIRNQATAGLYNYTPYQPNPGALAANPGTAPCGAYGNRNFWTYYTSWFGDPRTYAISATANRIDGPDRFAVAAGIATQGYPSGTDVVYVANGRNFPDGLVSAPAAARAGAPLLLTDPESLPASTITAIQNLGATQIVVVGGPASVSEAVYEQLAALIPGGSIRRDAGLDRFSAAREIARAAFDSAPTVYLANGLNFPDALSTSAAAGAAGAPILLVQPWDTQLDAETLALLSELGTTRIIIAGGPASVSSTLQSWLSSAGVVPTVERLDGGDRFSAGLAVNRAAFPTATRAYVASGMNFPDAMAAAAVAAATGRPLLLSPGWCTPIDTLRYFESAGVSQVDFLGGVNTLSPRTTNFEVCS